MIKNWKGHSPLGDKGGGMEKEIKGKIKGGGWSLKGMPQGRKTFNKGRKQQCVRVIKGKTT